MAWGSGFSVAAVSGSSAFGASSSAFLRPWLYTAIIAGET